MQKYQVVKADDGSIYGKKGRGGAICVKTSTMVVIGIYNADLQSDGQAASIVEKLGDYFREQGY